MSEVPALYAKFLFEQYGYRATFPPGLRLALGDVGFLKDGIFDRYTTLAALGVTFDKEKRSGGRERATHVSSDAVEVKVKAAGETAAGYSSLVQASAGALIRFRGQAGFVVSFDGMSHWSIVDHRALEGQLLDLYRRDQWDRRWFVVTQLVAANSATVLISEANGGEVEISAKANLGADLASVGNADAGLSIIRSEGLSTALIAEGSITPMFKARHLRRRLLRPPVFEVRVEAQAGAGDTGRLEAADLELGEEKP